MIGMKRYTAKKVRIKDIVEGRFFHGNEELRESFLVTPLGQKISRVNLIASVIDKFLSEDGNYAFIVIDDGSESMRVKAFDEVEVLEGVEIGDLIQVIGRVREFNGEIYLTCELIRKVDPNLEILRKLEILKELIKQKKILENIRKLSNLPEEELISFAKEKYGMDEVCLKFILENLNKEKVIDYKPAILKLIESLDKGEGVEIGKIFELSNLPENEIEKAIDELLSSGELFEPKPGVLKRVGS